jgi:hypothetical protein
MGEGEVMISKVSKFRDELADREAIKDVIYLYCRGMDRCDEKLFRDVFWSDARIKADRYEGPPDEFIKVAIPTLRSVFTMSWHHIGNIVLRIDGDKAAAEAYFHSCQCMTVDGVRKDTVISGRYLDKFERRNDEWRISEKVVTVDWYRDYADAADWAPGPLGQNVTRGGRAPDDGSFALFKGL